VIRIDPKWFLLRALFGRWHRPGPRVDGYTILLPSPMDMPFLLRFALEGLRQMETTHCRQIIVIPDGCGDDGGKALREVIESCGDSRVEFARLRAAAHLIVHGMWRSGGGIANWSHWAMIVEGTERARCEHIFLHDADAFFLETDGLERQYRECRDRGMETLGVTARWDPFFREIGYSIPGTWELMFSAGWARRRSPLHLKGRWRDTPRGPYEFDTMLYPQYLDYPTGKVGILDPPPRLLHFAGAITTYRTFCDRAGRPVVDELFRLLLLSLLEDLLPSPDGERVLPTVGELARGLDDPASPITYSSQRAIREYPIFRAMIEDLCDSTIFRGPRADRIRGLIRPFDEHFAGHPAGINADASGDPIGRIGAQPRRHGLG
jgi:hypothetical protein